MLSEILNIECQVCGAVFKRKKEREKKHPLSFCAYCGSKFGTPKNHPKKDLFHEQFSSIYIPAEKAPDASQIQSVIGQYQILKSIGKGGMGEVFLAYDTVSGRKVALKRIREDLMAHPQLQGRFLREARLTSQLTHPTIIPIYSIHHEDKIVYYTMPFVEGETLRQVLRRAKEVAKKHESPRDAHTSIPSLIRIFLQVCQACAYAHHHGVLHRDLKPENFIIGKFGQVLILDWGLAKMIDSPETSDIPDELQNSLNLNRITRIGKIVGTIAYMAPERATGSPSTVQTDIYALGVILYQILTLNLPFHRKNLEDFKKNWKKEQFIQPELLAPYREVPQVLSEITKKCLAKNPEERYRSVDELIQSLENYIEGRSEWFYAKSLDIKNKEDWEFQEHILIAEHTALTRSTDVSDWVNLMISKDSFPSNTKIEAEVFLEEGSHGIGFLFSIPEAIDRKHLTEGYCLWFASASEQTKKTRLSRSSVSLVDAPDVTLKPNEWQKIRIEKIDGHIYVYLNEILQFTYVSHIPITGTHVGILAKDADFQLQNFRLSTGSQHLTVSCLAVPDAFLANKDYEHALSEYRRIGAAFPGRTEGREALFRAGITLLEKAKNTHQKSVFDEAYNEFANLHHTTGAPLEYLGKALVFETLQDYGEEIKCYELGLRRYKRHPLIEVLEEQIAMRMHESAKQNRKIAYEFVSLAIRFLPVLAKTSASMKLFKSLEKNWEIPNFLLHNHEQNKEHELQTFSISLAFWTAKPYLIREAIDELLQQPILPKHLISDAIFCLIELGSYDEALEVIKEIRELLSEAEQARLNSCFKPLELAITLSLYSLQDAVNYFLNHKSKKITKDEARVLALLLKTAIAKQKLEHIRPLVQEVAKDHFQIMHTAFFDAVLFEAYFYLNMHEDAEKIIQKYPQSKLFDESSPLYFCYGCLLAHKNGQEAAKQHFATLLETPYPRSWLLGAHYLNNSLQLAQDGWMSRSFMWERRTLFEQLAFFYTVAKIPEKANAFAMQAAKEYVYTS